MCKQYITPMTTRNVFRDKHIMIKISFVLWKVKIQDQIISLEQVSTCGTANQRFTTQCIQRTTVDMSLW
jgi:hypothetical protein